MDLTARLLTICQPVSHPELGSYLVHRASFQRKRKPCLGAHYHRLQFEVEKSKRRHLQGGLRRGEYDLARSTTRTTLREGYRHKGSYRESGIFGSFSISDSKSHSASDLLREFLMLYLVVYKDLIMYFVSMDT